MLFLILKKKTKQGTVKFNLRVVSIVTILTYKSALFRLSDTYDKIPFLTNCFDWSGFFVLLFIMDERYLPCICFKTVYIMYVVFNAILHTNRIGNALIM